MKIKKISYLIVVFGAFILICFSTCKKYPENTLWFKRAKTLSPVGGTITNYCVNGIDSLQYLDAYYNTNFVNNTPNKTHHISDEFFYSSTEDFVIVNQTMITGSYRWQNKYKEIEIDCKNDTLVYKKNLFIKSVEIQLLLQRFLFLDLLLIIILCIDSLFLSFCILNKY